MDKIKEDTPQVIERNKSIAEFMGTSYTTGINENQITWYQHGDKRLYLDELQYHTSWDWLMPVVEKIEGLDLGVTVVIKENKCGIYRHKGSAYEYLIEKIETETKIAATYLAILKFIEWYNQINNNG